MQKIRSIIYLAALGTILALLVLINPLLVAPLLMTVLIFSAVARRLNFYKIVMMMKQYAKNLSKLRLEARAKLHMGIRDYHGSMENDEARRRSYGYVR